MSAWIILSFPLSSSFFFFFLESELVKSSSTREKDGKIVARGVYFNAPNFTIFLKRGNVFYACFAKTSHSAFEFACSHRFRLGPTSCSATTTSETTKSPLLPFFFFFFAFILTCSFYIVKDLLSNGILIWNTRRYLDSRAHDAHG